MKVSFQSKGDFSNALAWLTKVSKPTPSATLNQIAEEGTRALAAATPKDTGETSSGWVSEVISQNGSTEIIWKNNAHPESEANIAKLIEVGYGTRTGGYVAPRPYIKQAMAPTWKTVEDKLVKELIK